jgi:PsbP
VAAELGRLDAAYVNQKQGYSIQLPIGWTAKQKAGADALFEDPDAKSTNIGITVNPVRVASLDAFGDINKVADKLLEAERQKVGSIENSTVALWRSEPWRPVGRV